MGLTNSPSDLLPGTLELLILKALARGSLHGYGIVEHLRLTSGDVLRVGESALYPALQRVLLKGWATAEWGTSENNRRALLHAHHTWPPPARSRARGVRPHGRRHPARAPRDMTTNVEVPAREGPPTINATHGYPVSLRDDIP